MNNTKLAITITAILTLSTFATAQGQTTSFDTVLLNTDPVPVQSGQDAEITFKVRNTGTTEAENVEVQLEDKFPFRIKPDRKKVYQLGTMTPGEEYYITTEVLVNEEASDGENNLEVKVKHKDFTVTEKIPVNVRSDDIELNLANLETSPSDLKPDTENNQLNLEVVNNGEKTAESATVKLNLPQEFEQRNSLSTRKSLGNIKAGEKKEASFNFDITENASKGEKQIQSSIQYSRDDDTRQINQQENFSVYLSGKPQYRLKSVNSTLNSGEKGEIRIQIENYGSEKSESTRIRILDNSDMPFEFDSSNKFIGTLKPGATGTAIYTPTIEKGTPSKQQLLDLEITGTKDTEVFVDQKTTALQIQATQKQQNTPIPIILAVLILGGIGIYLAKRKNLFSKSEEENS